MNKRRRVLSLIMCLLMFIFKISEADATYFDNAVYLKQASGSKQCTLVSNVMMLRRRAFLENDPNWELITIDSVGEKTWGTGGMAFEYTYNGKKVYSYGVQSELGLSLGDVSSKKQYFIDNLVSHPEGIVIYVHHNKSYLHAVLLTDYDASTDTFYCADPAPSISSGRIPLSQSLLPNYVKQSYPNTGLSDQDLVIGYVQQTWMIIEGSGPVQQTPAEQYINQCSSEPCNVILTVTTSGHMNDMPCSRETNAQATKVEDLEIGHTYTSLKRWFNPQGSTWYEVTSTTGKRGFIYSGDVSVSNVPSTLSVSGNVVSATEGTPSGVLTPGNNFGLRGVISSNYMITHVEAHIYDSAGHDALEAYSVDWNGTSYNIRTDGINNNFSFRSLESGKEYRYVVAASDASENVMRILIDSSFSVGSVSYETTFSTDYPNTWANTGNQAIDIAEIAYTQVGYTESHYSATDKNHCKYNNWYYGYDKGDNGDGSAAWCATFVSWCANQAEIPESIIHRATHAYPGSGDFEIPYESFSSAQPAKGDLIFVENNGNLNYGGVYGYDHVGIVYAVDNSFVYTVEGNDNNRVTYNRYSKASGVDTEDANAYIVWLGKPNYTGEKPEMPIVTVPHSQFAVSDAVTVSWNAAARAENYTIQVFKNDFLIYEGMTTSLSYTLSNTEAGTYMVKVFANNSAGTSGSSSCTFSVIAKPDMPTVSVSKSQYAVGETMTVSWSATPRAESYVINLYKDGVLYYEAETTSLSYSRTVTDPGAYVAYVSAGNSAGRSDIASCSFSVIAQPSTPTVTVPQSQYTAGDTITMSWNAVAGNDYYWINVFRNDVLIVDQSMENALSYTLTNAQAGSYLVNVSANNSAGTAGSSCTFSVNATLNLDGYLDGAASTNLGSYGKADIYINGNLIAEGSTDYWGAWPIGTSYEIKNIIANDGYRYNGVQYGSLNGTIDSDHMFVVLSFSSLVHLNMDGLLDGIAYGGLEQYGTADVYINGNLVAAGCNDYWDAWPVGTTYEIKNIQANDGYQYNGVASGSLSGTIGKERIDVVLSFSTVHSPIPDLILPAALTTIDDEAFTGGAFTYVKLPDNAVSIGRRAFADCPNLAYIYIPAQTTQIDAQAFGNMQGLTILGKAGSTAEAYAQNHHFNFTAVP